MFSPASIGSRLSLFSRCTISCHLCPSFAAGSKSSNRIANLYRKSRIDSLNSFRTVAIMSQYPHILLRAEEKPLEHRSFSPSIIKTLVEAGYPVSVERSSTDPKFKRIFEDSEYEAAGARLVNEGTWPNAEPGTLILGLKEIPEDDFP